MLPITDIFTICLSIFLLLHGGTRGFLSSLLGPVSLTLSSVLAYLYFALTKNIPIALCIGLLGPFVLGWLFRFFLHSLTAVRNPTGRISTISRIAGALITLIWGLIMLSITILLLAMLPPVNKPLEMLYKDIHNSRLYQQIKPWDSYAADKSDVPIEVQSLTEDKRIQDIINDPAILRSINNKDYSALISNPKITAIMQDPKLMKQILGAYRQVLQEQSKIEAESHP